MNSTDNKLTLWRQTVALLGSIAACFLVAGMGAAATTTSVRGWYQTLSRPSWTPPDWVFGPVWTVLYLLMAVAAWLVWRRAGWSQARPALFCFGVQLLLNLLWSIVFFGLRQPGLAFAEIIVLWLAIVATVVAFRRHSPTAALLLSPYLAWSSFAAFLNLTIWRMNAL